MSCLIIVTGAAGAGKTTIAEALASKRKIAYLDMDTLLRPAAISIMSLQGLDPNDRDSPEYKRLCRDLGYRITMDAALENIKLGIDAIVIGPFTKETQSPLWLEEELARVGLTSAQINVKVIVVSLADEELYKERFMARDSELDAWKLEHWHSFKDSLQPRSIAWQLKDGAVLYFDNSEPLTKERIVELEQFIDA